jgi:hypothetical protein
MRLLVQGAARWRIGAKRYCDGLTQLHYGGRRGDHGYFRWRTLDETGVRSWSMGQSLTNTKLTRKFKLDMKARPRLPAGVVPAPTSKIQIGRLYVNCQALSCLPPAPGWMNTSCCSQSNSRMERQIIAVHSPSSHGTISLLMAH